MTVRTPALRPTLAPAPRRAADSTPITTETPDATELLAAAQALPGGEPQACSDARGCTRPGALTLLSADGAAVFCGLHAMETVFRSADSPVAIVRTA